MVIAVAKGRDLLSQSSDEVQGIADIKVSRRPIMLQPQPLMDNKRYFFQQLGQYTLQEPQVNVSSQTGRQETRSYQVVLDVAGPDVDRESFLVAGYDGDFPHSTRGYFGYSRHHHE